MASQPANSTISVYRVIRGQRGATRHESIKALTGGLRKLDLQVPGDERPGVVALTLDTVNKGVTPYDRAGLPIVVGAKVTKDFSTIETLAGIASPVAIGHDRFVENSAAGLASGTNSDLQKKARAL